MKIRCYTNLDEYRRAGWPTSTNGEPQMGDYITAEDRRKLKVVGRTWLHDGTLCLELHR